MQEQYSNVQNFQAHSLEPLSHQQLLDIADALNLLPESVKLSAQLLMIHEHLMKLDSGKQMLQRNNNLSNILTLYLKSRNLNLMQSWHESELSAMQSELKFTNEKCERITSECERMTSECERMTSECEKLTKKSNAYKIALMSEEEQNKRLTIKYAKIGANMHRHARKYLAGRTNAEMFKELGGISLKCYEALTHKAKSQLGLYISLRFKPLVASMKQANKSVSHLYSTHNLKYIDFVSNLFADFDESSIEDANQYVLMMCARDADMYYETFNDMID